MAMASSAADIRSPAVSSMSSSRGGGIGRDLLGEVEQLVGRVAHRGDDDDDVVAGLAGGDDPLGDPLDAVGVGDRGAAVLLHDQAHDELLETRLARHAAVLRAYVSGSSLDRASRAGPSATAQIAGTVRAGCRASNSASATTSSSASSRRWPRIDWTTRSALAARGPHDDR